MEVTSYLRRILTPGDADDNVPITLAGTNQRVVEIEISNSMAFDESYATVCGDRGALSYDQNQKEIKLRYLDPNFSWSAVEAVPITPSRGFNFKADDQLPWMEETRLVDPQVNMWDYVEVEIARHLYNALRKNVPFPIKNEDALEVVRVSEIVKKQNPSFAWIG